MHAEVIADYGCDTAECPVWDPDAGVLYWLDIYLGQVYASDPIRETTELIHEHPGEIGGLTLQVDGSLLLFGEQGRIWTWHGGATAPVVESVPVERHTRFNDVAAGPEGRVYGGTKSTRERRARFYRLDHDGALRIMLDDVGLSNGIGFSPDHERLYYTDSWTDRIDVFDFEPATGELTNRRPFVTLDDTPGMPDGLTVDAQGYVWSAQYEGGHVARFTPNGDFDRRIELPVSQVTSLAFGGPDLGDLYVTTGGGTDVDTAEYAGAVFRLDPGVRGREEYRSRIQL